MLPTIFTFSKEPKVTLVGAGPGDPELLTLKALNVLRQADVVLYDALVSQGILDLIPSHIPVVNVGKRVNAHSYKQDEINDMIVEMAFMYGHVVRLKGGDPFVFGRGAEEIDFVKQHGINTELVPGISSAIAVPASIGIPVTSRGHSESFWVVTGTTKSGELSGDIALAAQSSATVVILMGLNKVEKIMDKFLEHDKGETPVAIIQNGTLPNQKSIIGKVSTIASLVTAESIGSPAVIVIGEVVRHATELDKIIVEHSKRSTE